MEMVVFFQKFLLREGVEDKAIDAEIASHVLSDQAEHAHVPGIEGNG